MKNLLLVISSLILSLNCFGQNNFKYPIKNKINKNAIDIRHSKREKPIFITDSVKLLYKELEKLAGENPIYDIIPNNKSIKSNSLTSNNLAYPILFVHGLTGDSETWEEMETFLEPALGAMRDLDFCLNNDWSDYSSNMSNDVESFIPTNLGNYNLYKIDFNCDPVGQCWIGGSSYNSNQSAITKQGKAIGMAVDKIINATGKSKVILIGHSMGGLAIREYLQNEIHWLDSSHNIAKLITVGTPHCGTDIELGGTDFIFDLFSSIEATSEAIRDLRSRYDIGTSNISPGSYLWDGYESQSYMNDNTISSWDNVDVNCNGYTYEDIIGINHKSIYSSVEYASIRDVDDFVVTSSNVGWGWSDDYSAGEDFCSVLSHWSGEEDRHCESWGIDVFGLDGGHSALAEANIQNLWALDEPDDYDRAYLVELNIQYAGFITPQASNGPYTNDFDDYKIYIPEQGVLNINASFNDGSEGDIFSLYDLSLESTINVVYNVTSSETMSTEVTPGYYIIEFYGSETESEGFSQYFFTTSLNINGCTDPNACNFNENATDENGSCIYAQEYYLCSGACINDNDGDGICDELEIVGCTDSYACNYNSDATDSNTQACNYLDFELNYLPNSFIVTATYDVSQAIYTWYINGQLAPEIDGNYTLAEENGLYELVVYDLVNQCEGSQTIEVYGVGISETESIDFTMVPNPAKDYVLLNFNLNGIENVVIEFTNTLGQQVKSITLTEQDFDLSEFRVETNDLRVGTYFVNLKIGNKIQTKVLSIIK